MNKLDRSDENRGGMESYGSSHGHGSAEPIIPSAIGSKLRSLYEEVASEPVPDRFSALLEELSKSSPNQK